MTNDQPPLVKADVQVDFDEPIDVDTTQVEKDVQTNTGGVHFIPPVTVGPTGE